MPKPGEVYRDNYKYEGYVRQVRVIGPADEGHRTTVVRGRSKKVAYPRWIVEDVKTGRRSKVAEDSFHDEPRGSGYSLVEEASHGR